MNMASVMVYAGGFEGFYPSPVGNLRAEVGGFGRVGSALTRFVTFLSRR